MSRLLIVCTVAPTFGFLMPFVHHFRGLGWRVDGLAQGITQRPDFAQALDHAWEVTWSRNPLAVRNTLRIPHRIRELVIREQYDIVHTHTPVASMVTRYALRNLRKNGKPHVVYTAHGFHFQRGQGALQNAAFLALEKMAGRWTDDLIVMNDEDAAAAKQHRLVAAERIHYMPGIGLDLARYSPEAVSEADVAQVRGELQLGPQDRLFLMVAEFIPRKRHRDALAALQRLNRPEAHLALAGRGHLTEAMQKLAAELGVEKQAHFLGFRRDIPALTRASVAVLLPSAREGLPRSIQEALSLEVPVIGADIRGTRDLLQGKYGLLVPVGDVEGLARAMAWVLDHPDEAAAMGRQGRIAMQQYDVRKVIALHEALYHCALEGNHVPQSG